MKKRVSVTKDYIDQLKAERDDYRDRMRAAEIDRDKFRAFFLSLLRDNVSMTSENKYFSTQAMVLKLSNLMNSVERWYWS
jgi:hypothetical protein